MKQKTDPASVPQTETEIFLRDYKLPCDVTLTEGPTIKAGCALSTLVTALDNRRSVTMLSVELDPESALAAVLRNSAGPA